MTSAPKLKPRQLAWLEGLAHPGRCDSAWVVVEVVGEAVLLWSQRTRTAQWRRTTEIVRSRSPRTHAEKEVACRPWKSDEKK